MMRALAGLLFLTSPLAAQTWTVGSRVHSLIVCARPDSLGAGTGVCGTGGVLRTAGDKGTLIRGPTGALPKWGVSWYVHYDTPPDGWSSQAYLALDSLAVPPPPPPPPPTTGAPRTVTIGGLIQMIGVTVGRGFTVAALPLDSTGTLTAAPVTWSAADSSVVKIGLAVPGLTQAANLTALRVGSTTVTASAAGLMRSMTFTGLPEDTTRVAWIAGGVQIPSLPSLRHFTLPITLTLYSRPCYVVNVTAPGTDSVVATTLACFHKP